MTKGSADEVRPAAGATITPLDIQQKEFRVSRFGGYRMRDVDEFLDRLTEVVTGLTEENARLRYRLPLLGYRHIHASLHDVESQQRRTRCHQHGQTNPQQSFHF